MPRKKNALCLPVRPHCVTLLLFISLLVSCNRKGPEGSNLVTTNQSPDNTSLAPADSQTPQPSLQPSPTLMEKLDPNRQGIDFVHTWKPRDRYESLLLKTGFTGGGVCMGDYDGDGLTDVLLTRPHGGMQLYRNLGDFRFENATQKAGVERKDAWTTGAAMVDLNRDNQLDLVVCSYDAPNLIFVNQGNGKFREMGAEIGLNFRGASIKLAWADYDNDGDLDGYLTTNRLEPKQATKVRYLGGPGKYRVAPEHLEQVGVINLPSGEQKFYKAGQADHLFENQLAETGELRFVDVTAQAKLDGYFHGLDVTWWDANGDQWPDLYVANDFTDPDQFFKNNGDGTFTDVTQTSLPCTPWFTMGAAFADLNRDGRLDLLATDMAGTSHYRQKMAMGSMETLAWFLDSAEPRQNMRNALFLNTGTDRFLEMAQAAGLANSDWTWSVKLADLDNDGYEDAFMTNGFTRDYLDSDFNLRLKKSGNQNSLAWYDAPILKEANLAFRNQASQYDRVEFQNVSKQWGLNEVGISFGAAYGDLDNDGDLDLIVNNFDGPPSIYRNGSPQSSHRIKIALRGTKSNSQGYGAVVKLGDQMRWFNPHNGYMSSNDPHVYFGLADQSTIPEITVRWPSGLIQTVTNVAANQLLTITEKETRSNADTLGQSDTNEASFLSQPAETMFIAANASWLDSKHVERPFDDYQDQPLLPNKLSQLGPGMAWADVNGDGLDDVYLGGAAGQAGQLMIAKATGQFHAAITQPFTREAESEDMGCLFIDADSDGDLDLFVVSGGVEAEIDAASFRDRLYLNQGIEAGQVVWQLAIDRLPDLKESGGPTAAADFDRDGDLDLIVGGRVTPGQYPLSSPSRLLVNEGGRFEDRTQALASDLLKAGMVTSAVWCDVDANGWCDLVLACEYGPIRLFANRSGRLEERTIDAGLDGHHGWWNGLAVSDVDADGDVDLVATNFGLNTKYHPSPEHPQMIFFADFDGSGKTQIVEAKSTGTTMLPTRGRSCSSNAMPVLREKFETYHSFATAELSDIYTQSRLDESLQLTATTLASSLLINDGTGRFEFRKLPPMAQSAPGFGVQFLETGGRLPSLFVAQNFYHPQRETGRMNGGVGVLMTHNAERELGAVWPDISGIVVPEDARSAAAIDVDADGCQDLVITLNDGTPRCFLQQSRANKQTNANRPVPFAVRLRGKRGNEGAIGAHVTGVYADGTRAVRVVCGGEGYLTQVPNRVYFGSRPSKLLVRWPDGQTSEQDVPQDTVSAEIDHKSTRP